MTMASMIPPRRPARRHESPFKLSKATLAPPRGGGQARAALRVRGLELRSAAPSSLAGMTDVATIRCESCGAMNRVPRAKLAQGLRPKCGRCKQPLPEVSAAPLIVTDATFAADVERSPLPVLVDAWAAWCGPCRTIAPAIDALAAELAGSVRVAKLNVDENPATAEPLRHPQHSDLARIRRRPRSRPHRRCATEGGDPRASRARTWR